MARDTLPTLKAIEQMVSARLPWGIEALRRLIAVDSLSPNEKACQETLVDLLRIEGLPARLVPIDEGDLRATDGFIDSDLPLGNRPNLVVAIGRGDEGHRSLILNSHIDVVSWLEGVSGWQSYPLAGAVRGGKIFGRGAVDAKGQVMTAILAILALRDLGYEPGGRLILESVVGEEPDGNGTLALCSQGWLADAAVVLEPTDNHIAYGHRGIAGLRLLVKGQAGHAAVLTSSANAILAAGQLARVLDGALAGWSAPSDKTYGPPSVNVGRIQGGEGIFTIPESCTLECGVRYAPGTYDSILHHIQTHLSGSDAPIATPTSGIWELSVFSHYDAAEVAPDSPLALELLACMNQVAPDRRLVTFPGGCDARHFVNRYGVPAVVFGPGQLAVAHGVDEFLSLDQWVIAIQALALFVTRWCG